MLRPSVIWHCWLGSRKGIRPVKNLSGGVLAWLCLEWCADLHMAQLMPLPRSVSCFSKIRIGFTFLVPAHLGSPGQRAVKRVCVCVTVLLLEKKYLAWDKSEDVSLTEVLCALYCAMFPRSVFVCVDLYSILSLRTPNALGSISMVCNIVRQLM